MGGWSGEGRKIGNGKRRVGGGKVGVALPLDLGIRRPCYCENVLGRCWEGNWFSEGVECPEPSYQRQLHWVVLAGFLAACAVFWCS